MSENYINFLVNNLESRWHEIVVLLETAEANKYSNIRLHDAICRSVSVLMVSNLEGFYKDLIKNLIEDLNNNNRFEDLTEAIQRQYCTKFLDIKSSDKTKRALSNILIEEFKTLNSDINPKPFLYDKNNNPKPQIIDSLFENLGINIVFKVLEFSRYEEVFSEGNNYLELKISEYINELNSYSSTVPYLYPKKTFRFLDNKPRNTKSKTLWEEFLDQLNKRRHEIAHGNDAQNIDSVESLILLKNKTIFLQLALIHIVIEKFGSYTAEFYPNSIAPIYLTSMKYYN